MRPGRRRAGARAWCIRFPLAAAWRRVPRSAWRFELTAGAPRWITVAPSGTITASPNSAVEQKDYEIGLRATAAGAPTTLDANMTVTVTATALTVAYRLISGRRRIPLRSTFIVRALTGTFEAPVSYAVKSGRRLPPGLTLDSNGFLRGTPAEVGKWSVPIIATDSTTPTAQTHEAQMIVVVERNAGCLVTRGNRTIGPSDAFKARVDAGGLVGHVRLSLTKKPSWLALRRDRDTTFIPPDGWFVVKTGRATPGVHDYVVTAVGQDGGTVTCGGRITVTGSVAALTLDAPDVNVKRRQSFVMSGGREGVARARRIAALRLRRQVRRHHAG